MVDGKDAKQQPGGNVELYDQYNSFRHAAYRRSVIFVTPNPLQTLARLVWKRVTCLNFYPVLLRSSVEFAVHKAVHTSNGRHLKDSTTTLGWYLCNRAQPIASNKSCLCGCCHWQCAVACVRLHFQAPSA